MANLEIRLKKVNKIYREGDVVSGVVVVTCKGELPHNGIQLTLDGSVNLQLSSKSVGLFEAFYNSLKPIQILFYSLELAKAGKLPNGKIEIPFEFPLKPKQHKQLYETYHGVFVNVQYFLRVEVKRSLLSKDLIKESEIIVEYKDQEDKAVEKRVDFTINPDSVQNVKERQRVPVFEVCGHFDSSHCCITQPFTGELVVKSSDVALKSIELQLIRVETCGCAEGFSRDATEIQNIQVAEGDVCRDLVIPLYMSFPRLFTCPTIATNSFKIEFEVNVVIVFHDDHLVTENFPIKLSRY